MMKAIHLEKHSYANQDIGLFERSESPPSRPETLSIPLRSLGFSNRPLVPVQQLSLLGADTQQLNLIGLEKSNPKRKIDTHDPKFSGAQEMSIGGVGQHDLDEIDMKEAGSCHSERNIPHLEIRNLALGYQPCNSRVQDDSP